MIIIKRQIKITQTFFFIHYTYFFNKKILYNNIKNTVRIRYNKHTRDRSK